MGRATLLVIVCLIFSFSGALAEPPLTPGKPAGVHRAQVTGTNGAIAVGALVLIAVVGYAISTPAYHIPGAPTANAATSTQP
jgi:hypothetical protein